MKLNIPKCQCSFTLLRNVCIVEGETSCFLSQVFLNIYQKMRLRLYKMNLQSFKSAVTGNLKLVYSILRKHSCSYYKRHEALTHVKIEKNENAIAA